MHICILNMPMEYYSPVCGGAVATVIMESARELIARGHEVTVLTMVNESPVYEVGSVVPVQARTRDDLTFIKRRLSDVRRKMQHWDWPYYEYFLRSYQRALGRLASAPDVVIVHNDLAAPRFIKRILPKTRVIAWLHNENRTSERNITANRQAVDHFVAVSSYIRDWTMQHHHVEARRITAIVNGVNLQTFFARPGFLEPRTPVRVLFASRIDRNKGPDLAADAVATLRAEGLPVSLTVAGGLWWYNHGKEMQDPFFRELKEKMDRAAAEYLGHVTREKIPALYRSHDVVCLLSRSQDPCPLVCLEALASGCALLASPRGGIPEACAGAAVLANPDDPVEVTAALRHLVKNQDALREQKQRGQVRATERSWSRVAEELEQVCTGGAKSDNASPAQTQPKLDMCGVQE